MTGIRIIENLHPHHLDLYECLPRFRDLAVEKRYRAFFMPHDRLLARIILIGAIFVSLANIVPDSLSGAPYGMLQGLYLSTFGFVFFSLVLLGNLVFIERYRQLDAITTIWWLAVITAVSVGNSLYPPGLYIHVVFDIVVLVAIYLLLPIGLLTQVCLAVLFTAANLAIMFGLKTGPGATESGFILVAYLTVHFLGIISCWQIHLSRRRQFAEHRTQEITSEQLQETLAELNILRGIIPICSYCKQIRDDQGDWHQVESYIKQHSDADFTHGICPDCLKKEFPREFAVITAGKNSDTGK